MTTIRLWKGKALIGIDWREWVPQGYDRVVRESTLRENAIRECIAEVEPIVKGVFVMADDEGKCWFEVI